MVDTVGVKDIETERVISPVKGHQTMRVVRGERLAFQAGTEDFEHPSPLQNA